MTEPLEHATEPADVTPDGGAGPGMGSNMAWSLLGGVCSGALLFGMLIAGGRILGPVEYGKAALVLAFGQVLMIAYMVGMDLATTRAIARAHDDHELIARYVSTAVTAAVAVIAILTVVVLFLQSPIAHLVHTTRGVVWGALGYGAVLALKTLLERMVAGLGRFRLQAGARLAEAAVAVVLFTLFASAHILHGFPVLAVALIAAGGVLACIYLAALRRYLRPAALGRDTLRALWRYGRLALVGTAFSTGLAYVDTVVVNRFLGARELGIYSAYYACSLSITVQLATAVSNVFFPAMGRTPDKRAILARMDRAVLRAFVPLVAGMGVVVLVILQLYGGSYPLIWRVLAVISVWAVLFATNATYAVLVNAHSERTYRRELIFQPVRLVVLIAAVVVLVETGAISVFTLLLALLGAELLETGNLRLIVRGLRRSLDAADQGSSMSGAPPLADAPV